MVEGSNSPAVRDVVGGDYRIRLDLSRQILRLSVPEVSHWFEQEFRTIEQPIYPRLRDLPAPLTSFVPAGLLLHKAKQFDDGLYAAVAIAAQEGTDRFPGKAALLLGLARALCSRADAREACVLLLVGCRLGGVEGDIPPDLGALVETTRRRFLTEERSSKPLGFYTWSRELEAIFRQDRWLQSELPGGGALEALVDTLRSNAALRDSYARYLALVSRLTNPFAQPDLRPLLTAPHLPPAEEASRPRFFPPSASQESELGKKLFGGRPIPEGFSLIDEMIRGIRASTLRLEPTSESGWYDYLTWSHEPLIVPESMPEAPRLSLDDSYRKELLQLYKGAQALARETHVKDLEISELGMAMMDDGIRRQVVQIAPDLTVEPLATLYSRRAFGYRFVRAVLERAFGTTGLRRIRRLTADGPVSDDLDTELAAMEALFRGAYTSVAAQIGMPPDPLAGNMEDAKRFAAWADNLATDADLGRDARMMVPIFYDKEREKTKVWIFLGWTVHPIEVDFEALPAAQGFDAAGRPIVEGTDFEIDFVSECHMGLSPVTAEAYVTQLLTREEFRAHCDRLETRSAILSELQ